jgi:DNA-binding LacI/PurR family transcriptional regulator
MALGAIHCLADAGLRVPHDVNVVGYDEIAESAHFLPPLTTVRQDFAEVGARAFQELHDAIAGHDLTRIMLAPTLVVRESTAPARRR